MTSLDDARYFRERLEAWQDANRDMGERFATVLEQREALLSACRAALLRDDVADCELGNTLRAAIAKATPPQVRESAP